MSNTLLTKPEVFSSQSSQAFVSCDPSPNQQYHMTVAPVSREPTQNQQYHMTVASVSREPTQNQQYHMTVAEAQPQEKAQKNNE